MHKQQASFNSSIKYITMMTVFALSAFGLFLKQAAARASSDSNRYDWGARECECMKGWPVRHAARSISRFCIDYDFGLEYEQYLAYEVDGEGGESYALWTRIKSAQCQPMAGCSVLRLLAILKQA